VFVFGGSRWSCKGGGGGRGLYVNKGFKVTGLTRRKQLLDYLRFLH